MNFLLQLPSKSFRQARENPNFMRRLLCSIPPPPPPPQPHPKPRPPLKIPSLFIIGLPNRTTMDRLKSVFGVYGNIRSANFYPPKEEKDSTHKCAFINYYKLEDAEHARKSMHFMFFDGAVIFINPVAPRGPPKGGPPSVGGPPRGGGGPPSVGGPPRGGRGPPRGGGGATACSETKGEIVTSLGHFAHDPYNYTFSRQVNYYLYIASKEDESLEPELVDAIKRAGAVNVGFSNLAQAFFDSIYGVHDKKKDKALEWQMIWVCDESNGQHHKVPDNL